MWYLIIILIIGSLEAGVSQTMTKIEFESKIACTTASNLMGKNRYTQDMYKKHVIDLDPAADPIYLESHQCVPNSFTYSDPKS